MAANASDFFGEGVVDPSQTRGAARDWTANPPRNGYELDAMYRDMGVEGGYWGERQRNLERPGSGALTPGKQWEQMTPESRAAYTKSYRENQGLTWGDVGQAAYDVGRFAIDPIGGAANIVGGPLAQAATGPVGAILGVGEASGAIPQNIGGGGGGGAAPISTGPVPTINVPRGPGVPQTPANGVPGTGLPPGATPPGGTGATGEGAGEGAPTVDRAEIDKLLGGLGTYQNALWQMSQDNTGLSAAEAMLQKATNLANIQAGIDTEKSQRSALGMARSSRNRGDRALLERQAVGEAGFIGQDAARTAALRRAEAEGNIATLRANEESADRTFKLEAIKAAADLGLNASALEVDIAKADLSSATNLINQQFETMRANGQIELGYAQLDQQKVRDLADFTRDMAIIQQKYDQMDVEAQTETQRLLMQKYGIDETSRIALEKIKADNDFDWNQLLIQFAGGAGKGATGMIAASDRRVKRNIQQVREDELDELLTALKAETWMYADEDRFGGGRTGLRFGPMAQDLEKTKLGKAMVKPFDDTGVKGVDTGAVALATASGLAHVYDRLKGLEAAVSK